MIIPANPYKVWIPFFKLSKDVQKPFSSLFSLSFYNNGREALFALCRALGIGQEDRVIFPAFICKSAVDVLRCSGIRIEYADVDDDLNYNAQELEKKLCLPNVKAIVAVNYFGFPADIEKIQQIIGTRSIHIIEDCAHTPFDAILTQDSWLGLKSSGVIFSIRKTHPVLYGGVMVLPQGKTSLERHALAPRQYFREFCFVVLKILEGIVSVVGLPNPYGQGVMKIIRKEFVRSKEVAKSHSVARTDTEVKQRICPLLVSKLFEHRLSLKKFSKIRRKNYQYLANILIELGYRVPWRSLPDFAIPMALPLHDPGGEINNWLRDKGIGSYRWPGTELPWEVAGGAYETTIRFANTITLLPVHQDINESHLKKIIELLRDYLAVQRN